MELLFRQVAVISLISFIVVASSACSNSVKPMTKSAQKPLPKIKSEKAVLLSKSSVLEEKTMDSKSTFKVLKKVEQTGKNHRADISQEAWRQLERLALEADKTKKNSLVQPSSPVKRMSDSVYGRLIQHFNEWQGTPYRYGGQSKAGIDCSAFVQITYAKRFRVDLPRTTELQIRQGKRVALKQLKVGDMVFFKTGWSTYHNGIYLGNKRFMHASSSKGVVVSSIEQAYWKERFIEARRLLN